MAILCLEDEGLAELWQQELTALLPDTRVHIESQRDGAEEVRLVVLWDEIEVFASHPNLEVAVILGAGIDHLLPLMDKIPEQVTLVRLVDPSITGQMLEWVTLAVLTQTRRWDVYREFQKRKNYEEIPLPVPAEISIGILGAGVLGAAAARLLASMGYSVSVWSRTLKRLDDVRSLHGEEGLSELLASSDYTVCMLPLTERTHHICDEAMFAGMKPGAYFINAARGEHVDETALLRALDTGRLEGATLDVQHEEPLPDDHPFWTHPKVKITPHVATISHARCCAPQVAENYRRLLAGEALINVVDRQRQY